MSDKDELYERLMLADEKNQIGFTRHLCELYLRRNPNHVPTLIRYASNLIYLAQYSAAKKALDRAEKLAPKKYLPLILAQQGLLLTEQGNYSRAERLFMKAHKLDPANATYLIYAGSVAFSRGDIKRAQAHARKATRCSLGCIDEAFFNLGGYLLSANQYRKAADCYRKALAIDPDYDIAKERLNDVELILGKKGLTATTPIVKS